MKNDTILKIIYIQLHYFKNHIVNKDTILKMIYEQRHMYNGIMYDNLVLQCNLMFRKMSNFFLNAAKTT